LRVAAWPHPRQRGLVEAAASVDGELVEQPVDRVDVGFAQAFPQLRVEGDRRLLQAHEQGLPVVGELDHVDPPVVGVAAAGDQPARIHRVQVMGEGGLADTDRLGELTLIVRMVDLQVEQDQPDRQGAAGLLERFVEGAADDSGGPPELQADRNALRSHVISLSQTFFSLTIRCLRRTKSGTDLLHWAWLSYSTRAPARCWTARTSRPWPR
jgi:hypothetical protein